MSQQRFPTVLLFGAPGVGKGTQGKILGHVPGFFHLSSGDVFRALQKGSAEQQEASKYISRGELVPDDLTIRIICAALDEAVASGRFRPSKDILVFDGIPRSVRQATMLEGTIDVLQIIHLVCPDEEIVTRLKGRSVAEERSDDSEDLVRYRLDVYRRETTPLLKHYPEELIAEVDAIGTPAAVLRKVLDRVVPAQEEVLRRPVASA